MKSIPVASLLVFILLQGFAQALPPTTLTPGGATSPGLTIHASPDARISQMDVSPATGLDSTGPVGGPFLPQSQAYTVSNTGTSALTFTATSTQAWCKVFAGGATLQPGDSWSVIIYIDDVVANTMLPGAYSDTVTFTNITDASGNTTRSVTLTITGGTGAGPMTVAPGGGMSSSGPVGGPFGPSSIDYTIINNDTTNSIDWSTSLTANWITLTATGGTLAPGASTTITASINANANSLAAGSYAIWISFNNVTSGNGNTTRAISLNVVSGPFAGPMTVAPGGGLTSTGPVGGPFTPASLDYTVTNNGTLDVTWQASNTQAWITLSSTGGTLAPGASAGVTVSINGLATGFAAGTYTDTVTFTNLSSGSGNTTRPVTLTITSGGAGPMTVTPATGITSSGPQGGPFTPLSQNYTVTNTGTLPMDYTVAATQSWMTVLPTSGTLAAGASATVQVSINGTAIFLTPGTYTDTATFTNVTSGSGTTTRPVTLTVTTPGPGAISVTPATGFTSSGPQGGPFTPASATYTVTNTGGATIDFAAFGGQPWVTVVPGFTTLTAGQSITVTVSINGNANTLTPGTYTDTVTFQNVTNGTGDTTRSVTLIVGASGDTTPPTVTIANPAPPTASTTSTPIVITGTASDNVGVTSVSWTNATTGGSGPASGTTSWSATVPLAAGPNLITITATDAAGNSGSASITITFTPPGGDTTPPTITITTPTTAPTFTASASPVLLGGTASDNVALSTITWSNAATGQSGTASGLASWNATVALNAGPNTITVSAFDTSGNSATDTITVTLGAGGPPPAKESPNGDGSVNDTMCGGSVRGTGFENLAWAALIAVLILFGAGSRGARAES